MKYSRLTFISHRSLYWAFEVIRPFKDEEARRGRQAKRPLQSYVTNALVKICITERRLGWGEVSRRTRESKCA